LLNAWPAIRLIEAPDEYRNGRPNRFLPHQESERLPRNTERVFLRLFRGRASEVTSGSALFRRWCRRKYFPAAWLWLGLWFRCFLGFFSSFVFISHGKQFDIKGVAGKDRQATQLDASRLFAIPLPIRYDF